MAGARGERVCAPQGCLALITNGRGGGLNILLGTDESGRDVFFYTKSLARLPGDRDSAGDIYDARIGGGSPAPRRVPWNAKETPAPRRCPRRATPPRRSETFSGRRQPARRPGPRSVRRSKAKAEAQEVQGEERETRCRAKAQAGPDRRAAATPHGAPGREGR